MGVVVLWCVSQRQHVFVSVPATALVTDVALSVIPDDDTSKGPRTLMATVVILGDIFRVRSTWLEPVVGSR